MRSGRPRRLSNFLGGGKKSGRVDDHQQVAKNFFLSSEKTYARKLYEALLSFKIESNLTKDQILELYINQIYLGQRAYGFGAAAQIYFGKSLRGLNPRRRSGDAGRLAESAVEPSTRWSIRNAPELRQQYVLRRMRELGFHNDAQPARGSLIKQR